MNKTLPIAAALLLIGLLGWLLFVWQPEGAPARPRGGDITVGDFSLADERGRVVLLYFGYMGCPDICPTSLGDMGRALRSLSEEELARVHGVFISVDPERDRPEDLTRYAHYFHANITGHTGPKAQVDEAVARYGAAYRMIDHDSDAGYQVDHTAEIYVIDPQGRWRDTLPYGTPAAKIAAAARAALRQGE